MHTEMADANYGDVAVIFEVGVLLLDDGAVFVAG
jgi:hypothetical protein